MTSINDQLSPDLLFNIFKRLDCIQTTRIRRVCKQWFEIIDEHKSFWRTLHLPKESVKWSSSILELFDEKSGSTLQEVEVRVPVEGEHRQTHFFDLLQKSHQSLEHLLVNFPWHEKTHSQKTDFLEAFPHVKSWNALYLDEGSKVRLRRRSVQDPDAASPLKVLWYNPDRKLLEFNLARFQNLVSFETGYGLSPSQWRRVLEGPSRTLKHLRIGFSREELEYHERVSSLQFPNLEVLELDISGNFPRWLLIPDTVKLITSSTIFNLPSISELWAWSPRNHENDITSRLPRLETLCLSYVYNLQSCVETLNERKANVEAGLQVDGVKIEMIKTLILPFRLTDPGFSEHLKQRLERCRELVEVVEGNASSRFIEVEY